MSTLASALALVGGVIATGWMVGNQEWQLAAVYGFISLLLMLLIVADYLVSKLSDLLKPESPDLLHEIHRQFQHEVRRRADDGS